MTKITVPFLIVENVVKTHRYNKMIKKSQKKLAETTPVSYTRIYA